MSIFSVPAKIITGEQALSEAMPFLKAMGARPLVVTGRHTAASPFFAEFAALLQENGLSYAVFSEITSNPFQITFVDLSGITLSSGIWNATLQRLEC